jgi:hypothetical protein
LEFVKPEELVIFISKAEKKTSEDALKEYAVQLTIYC